MEKEYVKITIVGRKDGQKKEEFYSLRQFIGFDLEEESDRQKYKQSLLNINNFKAGLYVLQTEIAIHTVEIVRDITLSNADKSPNVPSSNFNVHERDTIHSKLPLHTDLKTYYLVSYIWENDAARYIFSNDVTDKHPADWLLDINHQLKHHAILTNHLPITKQQYDELKDFM